MIIAIGLSNYQLALFHFSNHAFFKALLFLSAGVIIHGFYGEQDIRRMGGLRKAFPLSYTSFIIGSCSLIGFPFTSGYYSKDAIFENLIVSHVNYSWLAYFYACSASMFTAAYSVRLIYLVFFGTSRARRQNYEKATEGSSLFLLLPLIILSFFSIFIGYLTRDLFIGLGSTFWGSSILNLHSYAVEAEFVHPFIKMIPFLFSCFGGFATFFFFHYFRIQFLRSIAARYLDLEVNSKRLYLDIELMKFFNKRWYFDIVYVHYIILPLLNFGEIVSKNILERGYYSLLGPVGFSRFIDFFSQKTNLITNSAFNRLIFSMLFWYSFMLSFYVYF
jgi:NADH-ubiquinone oxidoreductase chain 5